MTPTDVSKRVPVADILETNESLSFTVAIPDDIQAIKAMLTRCSALSRLRRFFRLVPSAPPRYLEQVLSDPDHFALVIRLDGQPIGLAELHRTGGRSGDLGLVVEDAFQRRGIGTAAFRALVRQARKQGLCLLTADVQLENVHVIAWLLRVGSASVRRSHDVCHITLGVATEGKSGSDTSSCAA